MATKTKDPKKAQPKAKKPTPKPAPKKPILPPRIPKDDSMFGVISSHERFGMGIRFFATRAAADLCMSADRDALFSFELDRIGRVPHSMRLAMALCDGLETMGAEAGAMCINSLGFA
jgi:hypothetical protein